MKRLLCDCSPVTVAEDESGKALDVGRKQRTVSTARLEDFVDDDIGGDENASREGFCTTTVQREWERAEVRETAPVYRLRRSGGMATR